MRKELPKLPKGMGAYDYLPNGDIRYRKSVKGTRISVTGTTISEVNKLMKQKEDETLKRIKIGIKKESTGTLQENMNEWMTLYKKEDVIPRTYDRIESTYLTHIVGSELGTMQEKSIKPEDIQRFMKELKNHGDKKEDKDLSYSSKKKVYELLNQYFRYRYIKEPYLNPMLQVTKPKQDVEKVDEELIVWDDYEIEKICREASKPFREGVEGYKHGLAIIFIMWIFCRIGEALALQWKDIDIDNSMISITKSYSRIRIRDGINAGKYEYKIVKTKNKKNRTFKMSQMAIDAIKGYKSIKKPKSENEYVFSTNNKILTVTSITRMYSNIIDRTEGIDHTKHVTMHGLRHTGISYFLRHGVPIEVVSRMAGHQSIQITIDTYYSVIEEQKQKAIDDLNKAARINYLDLEEESESNNETNDNQD